MKKMDYEKPIAEIIRFSVEDMLMDGELPPIGGSTDSGVIEPWSFNEGYQFR